MSGRSTGVPLADAGREATVDDNGERDIWRLWPQLRFMTKASGPSPEVAYYFFPSFLFSNSEEMMIVAARGMMLTASVAGKKCATVLMIKKCNR